MSDQPFDVVAALAEASEWNYKHTQRIEKLEAELAEERAVIQRYQKALDAAVQSLQKAKMTLEVPAAEYVPAMSDAWELIEKALEKIR